MISVQNAKSNSHFYNKISAIFSDKSKKKERQEENRSNFHTYILASVSAFLHQPNKHQQTSKLITTTLLWIFSEHKLIHLTHTHKSQSSFDCNGLCKSPIKLGRALLISLLRIDIMNSIKHDRLTTL